MQALHGSEVIQAVSSVVDVSRGKEVGDHLFHSKQVKSPVSFSLRSYRGHHNKHWLNQALNPELVCFTLGSSVDEMLHELSHGVYLSVGQYWS